VISWLQNFAAFKCNLHRYTAGTTRTEEEELAFLIHVLAGRDPSSAAARAAAAAAAAARGARR
jgi:hypothetical protein